MTTETKNVENYDFEKLNTCIKIESDTASFVPYVQS